MPRTVIEPEKARQGGNGPRILLVLVVSLVLAMLVWWGVETYGVAIAPDGPNDGSQIEDNATQ